MNEAVLVHATAVAVGGRAVMIRGPSGSGKSDLALRLIDAGARLVADDQCELRRAADTITLCAPAAIAGLIELRGIGIIRLAALPEAPLALLVDLVPPAKLERLPQPRRETILGVMLPVVALAPFEASAAAKLRLAFDALAGAGPAAILWP